MREADTEVDTFEAKAHLQAVDAAIARLRALRERFGSLSVEEILAFRDAGRR